MRSMARWVLPVLVGPRTAVTPWPRARGSRSPGELNEMGIPASASARTGRRVTYTGLCVASLVIALAFFKTNREFTGGELTSWFYVSAFLHGGITASFYGFFPLYFPELFPTSVRATAQGFCFNFGRLIAAVGALQLGNLIRIFGTQANAYSILSCVYLVGAVIVWIGPETRGKALPE